MINLIITIISAIGVLIKNVGPYMKGFFKWLSKPSNTPRYIRWIIVTILISIASYLFWNRGSVLQEAQQAFSEADSLQTEINRITFTDSLFHVQLNNQIAQVETTIVYRTINRNIRVDENLDLRTRIDNINDGLKSYIESSNN